MEHTIQTTINKYKEEEGDEYVSITEEEAEKAIMLDECLNKIEKNGIIRNMKSQVKRKGFPPFIFVSPMAFKRYRLLQIKSTEICQKQEVD